MVLFCGVNGLIEMLFHGEIFSPWADIALPELQSTRRAFLWRLKRTTKMWTLYLMNVLSVGLVCYRPKAVLGGKKILMMMAKIFCTAITKRTDVHTPEMPSALLYKISSATLLPCSVACCFQQTAFD